MASLQRVAMPVPRPRDNELLIKVGFGALNFSDTLMVDDRYQVRPPRPFVVGQEIAGTVAAAGSATSFKPGDLVTGKVDWGGFAEYAMMRGDMAIRVPKTLGLAAACTLPVVYTTAMVALTESTAVKPGETVLVLAAAGGVGLAAVEIARHLGARIIAAAGGDDKCALAKRHGAHEAIDYRKDGWSAAIKDVTNGNGVDVVVDPVGGAAAKDAMRVLGWNARYLIVGFSSGEIPQIPANRLLLKRASAIGVYWSHDRDAAMLARIATSLTELAEAGAIKPHVGETFAFDQLPQALAALAERRTSGKVLLTISGEP
ncbi:MAG: NADPH:quinone oxidoreductase family protein [Pseudolabrys sp.]